MHFESYQAQQNENARLAIAGKPPLFEIKPFPLRLDTSKYSPENIPLTPDPFHTEVPAWGKNKKRFNDR